MSPLPFGTLPTGETIDAWTLSNATGASAQIITLGGIITHLRVPDRDGRLDDVVLGFDSLAPYAAGHPHFGAITGRIAGRLRGGGFTLDGQRYELARNEGDNHIHGGNVGLYMRVWKAEAVTRVDGADSVRLTYRSPNGEEGYPGNVNLAVTYTLTDAGELIMETEAVADRVTPISLTQHSYFNLAGEAAGHIDDHVVEIFADEFVPMAADSTLTGRRESVSGQPNDLRAPHRLGDVRPRLFKSHGDLYLVPRAFGDAGLVTIARISEPGSGRVLTVSTTETCCQFYTGVNLDGSCVGKSGRAYEPHAAFCVECEGYPEAVDTPGFGDILVRPGQPQRHTTVYAFSATSQNPLTAPVP